ncbi:MAG: tRNA(Ile2) 2-agmatinylcytidine synthetase [Methanoregula sp.]|jgi:methanogenesis imperfect marker protein 11|uniref:tRNA(Ile2) 2-agmatinylcytidine synthetase n=1 Tax=Methanoregula sp. TaxID=2052170 RepID=UPI0025CE7403|nr:tRNA(Ile2) 2-agmatinylcytidine synthetase [Methanoregula sp.]MCK9631410.1 tRNA(Ile2) 2-agmatinylcytidine synthetase [Methanoregula sp.]
MITLTPDEVKKRFGPLFSQKFLVMVDENSGRAEILEQCRARGPIEWDAMNRKRAGGAVAGCSVEGTSMVIRAKLGSYPVNFGAAAGDIGGQALESVEVAGDEVITTWAGIAGAGVGVAACLPQAPGVIRAEYPSEEDLNVGGARTNHVRIVSPRYEKVCIGVDDTDTKTEGATWVMALKCAGACDIMGVEFLNMRLIQLNPAVPNKTTNCVGSALNFAVRPDKVSALLDFVRAFIEKNTVSRDTGIAYYRGIGFPHDSPAFAAVKTEIMTLEAAESAAKDMGIMFIDTNGRKGRIGALGAVLWGNRGIEAAGLYGEHL